MSSVRTAARALHTVVTSKPPVREWLVILPDNTQVARTIPNTIPAIHITNKVPAGPPYRNPASALSQFRAPPQGGLCLLGRFVSPHFPILVFMAPICLDSLELSAETNKGPIFARPFVKGAVENRPFVGSVMIVNDTDPEAIRAKLKLDIYTQERIWDWENAEILPFHTLERSPAELEK
ncbi:hypothetical protein N7533_011619 [Penicillium manginii]|uniref:uncharacterized protein n=1 Tax=Penicillium manginii TaxID=203109 RepID=UPI00254706BF|nr:uncharacterized protein N7533_011619 [Penicillium manginii]KAJ5742210.1 hypothetical protein N7533_011619 [Penicillium manginii]